ncbi:anthranilate phosphoribosyltransferase [Longimicrobium sp.]|uniref:anthranilate phosphoribosyltransferase n=1 Tax=Longimicrobium sp. TaxID=2029185 RepID=UPI003B3BAA03
MTDAIPAAAPDADLTDLLRRATTRPLTAEEAERAFGEVMEGRATPVQMAALLVAIRVRGATSAEVAGGVRALRKAMVAVPTEIEGLVDTCGTGGGALTTFNISTAAALVAAGAGVRVAKHGNRSFTSRCGSADVLEALGVRLELDPEREARVLEECGIVFMFAPLHHPAMRHIGPIRRELAMPTLMNVLGPLTNPAHARRQVVGVNDPALLDLIAGALLELGHDRALVVHGEPGIDELSPLGTTELLEVDGGKVVRRTFDPTEELGWERFGAAGLEGGERDDNARKVVGVLKGEVGGSARAATVLNAGAAVWVAGMAKTLADGVKKAEAALDAGAGLDKLRALREASQTG